MIFDMSNFKVVHADKVYRVVGVKEIDFKVNQEAETFIKPKFLGICVLNEDGNLMFINDEAWTFQFIPVVNK